MEKVVFIDWGGTMEEEIEEIRQVLYELTKKEDADMHNGEILALSIKLDELIFKFYLDDDLTSC